MNFLFALLDRWNDVRANKGYYAFKFASYVVMLILGWLAHRAWVAP